MALDSQNVVVLVGGVGGAKLAHGLAQILPPDRLTVIVNTGDDFWHYGLRICPDLDTVMYTLGGVVDKVNGWGVAGDTRNTLSALQRYGAETWFGLGDQDIATHLLRTQALMVGDSLTSVTHRLTKALGIVHTVLPMTDAPVATKLDTVEQGELDFQVYFVRHHWQPTVRAIHYENIESATVTIEAQHAIERADVILLGPSNPWLSIAPILAVPGLRERLIARDVSRVAVSPIVGGQALKGPAAKMMAELGYEASAKTVADYYRGVINGFVYDLQDAELKIDALRTATFNTIMQNDADRAVLAREILEWIGKWGGSNEYLGDHSGQASEPGEKPTGRRAFPEERKQLSEMLFRRVLTAVKETPQIAGTLVISRDPRALAIARDLGAHTVQESGTPELNNALMRATQVVGGWRGSAVLILPADLPLITPEDLSGMLALGQENLTVVIATDNHEDGTNAMLIRPPGLIAYAYGVGSYRRHVAIAKEAGATVKVFRSSRLALDIDMPADLEDYYRLSGSEQEVPLTPGGSA